MIGQMIMIGFHGNSAADPRFEDVIRQLEAGLIGGVLFLGHNMTNLNELRKMTKAIRRCRCDRPPLIAIDEEGGRIQRLNGLAEFTRTPSAKAIAGANDDRRAKRAYAALAGKLHAVGFNFNLAPVVDVDIEPASPIIGRLGRSYSSDPTTVARFARIFVASHRARGILTALKHFPGHGSSAGDTHRGFVDVSATWRRETELAPYRSLIADGFADAIMVGHISNNAWSGLATMSPADAIAGILRRDLKFDGVVITDDLEMAAVRQNNPDFGVALVRAVQAGNDIILISNLKLNRPKLGDWANRILFEAVRRGDIPRTAIAASHARIDRLKSRLK
jgi:beta-N-acetylhexosaminidase